MKNKIYFTDTKKTKGCAYYRFYAKHAQYGFKEGEEITDFVAKTESYTSLFRPLNTLFFHANRSLSMKPIKCKRKVVGKDLFNRNVCECHAKLLNENKMLYMIAHLV